MGINFGETMRAPIMAALVMCVMLSEHHHPLRPEKRLVLIDQDGSGPADSNQMSMMVLLQAPQVEVLGITIVTGNAWRDEEVQHTLRMLELIGRSDVPVVPGAVFPLVRTQEETRLAMQMIGKPAWLGAWGRQTTDLALPAGGVIAGIPVHGPWEIPPLPEGSPKTKPLAEDAAHFLIRQVRAHPGQVTIYAAGPLTNIALAVSIEPEICRTDQRDRRHGRQLEPTDGRRGVCDQPAPRVQFLVRSGGGSHRPSRPTGHEST